jgi:non-heme chloroperoxidase
VRRSRIFRRLYLPHNRKTRRRGAICSLFKLAIERSFDMNRRTVLGATAAGGVSTALAATITAAAQTRSTPPVATRPSGCFVTAGDATKLFVQDWGTGRPVVFLAAWTFNSNVWGSHIASFSETGFRCIAPDRRGHGRSDAPSSGYDVNNLADDVAAVLDQLDLRDVILVAHSMGSIEAVNYLARHGSGRISKLILLAPTTPYLLKADDNADGIPPAAFEANYRTIAEDFPRWIAANEGSFFTPETIAETRNWIKAMMLDVSLPVALACRATIASTDLRAAIGKIDRPTLILHGDKDASAPLQITGAKTARMISGSKLIVIEGAPHCLVLTHQDRIIREVLDFIRA